MRTAIGKTARRLTLCLFALFCISLDTSAAQVPLVADVAEETVEIRTAFSGTDLLIFGATRCLAGKQDSQEPCDLIAVIKGPPASATVRRKARKNGIWVNDASVSFDAAPGYYALAATGPINAILDKDAQAQLQLGLSNLKLPAQASPDLSTADFKAGLFDDLTRQDLYIPEPQMILTREGQLFRMSFPVPANVPIGAYTIDIYAVSNGAVTAQTRQTLSIQKAGFEAFVTQAATQLPIAYGFLSIILAFSIGLGSSYIFKK